MPDRLRSFQDVLTAAIADIAEFGFDSVERIERWTRELRLAAEQSMISPASMEQQLRDGLTAIYRNMIDRDGIFRFNPGVERFTKERVRPALRAELDRRIMASANLIKLNRAESIETTLRRFQGWSTSIPKGGVSAEKKSEVKANVRKSLAQLPFEERRVLIDQGHKLTNALSEILATDGGAIAGRWRSHWKQLGYNYREDHKERDEKIYLVRDSWAHRAGYVKRGRMPYYDEITAAGQEPFCFPGDSIVPFADGVEKAYRRWYDGKLTTIITASGKAIRATPNHPVLTPKGWVAIGTLNEGDDVIEASEQPFDVVKKNDHDSVPMISEIFGTFQKLGGAQTTRNGQLHQFHGDGTQTDVDIINAARPLRFGWKLSRYKRLKKFDFPMSAIVATFIGALDLFIKRSASSGSRFVSCLDQMLATFFSFTSHADEICFAGVSKDTASDCQLSIDRMTVDAEVARQSQNTFASIEAPDEFVNIERYLGSHRSELPFAPRSVQVVSTSSEVFSGHVFNLQTESGWYVIDNIIVHNCRCYMIWLYNLRELPDDMLTAKGKTSLREVAEHEALRRGGARSDSAPKIGSAAMRMRLDTLEKKLERVTNSPDVL